MVAVTMRTGPKLLTALRTLAGELENRPEWGAGPWVMSHDGVEWVVATDCYALVAVHRALVSEAEFAIVPDSVAKLAATVLVPTNDARLIAPVERLRAFCGHSSGPCARCKSTRRVKCDKCHGSCRVACECSCGDKHEADCDECRHGRVACPACINVGTSNAGQLLGGKVNREKLAALLDVVAPDGEVSIALRPTLGKTKQFVFEPVNAADGWVAMLAPMYDYVAASVDFDKPETWPVTAAVEV